MIYARKTILRLLAVLMLFAAPIIAVHARYQWMVEDWADRYQLDAPTANAVKHTYAAAQLYATLRPLLSPEKTERLVLNLGFLNEYIENNVRRHATRDTLREVMKDLHNNQLGATLALWCEPRDCNRPSARLAQVIALTHQPALIAHADRITATAPYADALDTLVSPAVAIAWFTERQPTIRNEALRALAQQGTKGKMVPMTGIEPATY